MREEIKADLIRSQGNDLFKSFLRALKNDASFRYMYCWRTIKANPGGVLPRFVRKCLYCTNGIEIPMTVEIGPGMLMIHPRNITINSKAVIGCNFTILKGATIGSQLRGKNEGSPVIGNDVYVGLNATIVGKIRIGNNVLIAPNAYVNFDVPDNTIVIGNPGVCYFSERATEGYIKNKFFKEE